MFEVPLLNTVILLSSGAFITWGHHSLIAGNRKGVIYGTMFTIILAIIFTLLQGFEYYNAPFTIADSVYGSCFYFSTGFHGLHVLIGTIFLIVCFYRTISYQFTDSHHVGLESAILYWHFVDVVWLFLYISVYYWGS
jgi:cytochrome c oxidase subunit 3